MVVWDSWISCKRSCLWLAGQHRSSVNREAVLGSLYNLGRSCFLPLNLSFPIFKLWWVGWLGEFQPFQLQLISFFKWNSMWKFTRYGQSCLGWRGWVWGAQLEYPLGPLTGQPWLVWTQLAKWHTQSFSRWQSIWSNHSTYPRVSWNAFQNDTDRAHSPHKNAPYTSDGSLHSLRLCFVPLSPDAFCFFEPHSVKSLLQPCLPPESFPKHCAIRSYVSLVPFSIASTYITRALLANRQTLLTGPSLSGGTEELLTNTSWVPWPPVILRPSLSTWGAGCPQDFPVWEAPKCSDLSIGHLHHTISHFTMRTTRSSSKINMNTYW